MSYDFSSVFERRKNGSLKWAKNEESGFENAYPYSVADMEWGTAPAVRKACADFALNGFYTYTIADEAYLKTVCDFMQRRHNWNVEKEWITTTYGIVSAIHTCVRAFTKKGDGVIVQRPVYAHFMGAVELNDRKIVNNALVINNGRYEMNFDELEQLAAKPENKLMVLCSPHNPVGRVWTKQELLRVTDICYRNGVIVVSDEIHFDIVRKQHFVFANLSEKAAAITVTCTAASKSFNIAGLGTSHIIISDEKLRKCFQSRLEKDGYECINCFAYPALMAAYTQCDDWLDTMNERVYENYVLCRDFFKENLPQIRTFELEGTYLLWLDISALNIPDGECIDFFGKNAGIIPNAGGWFGKEGEGFIRLNIAVPKQVLIKSLEEFKKAVEAREKIPLTV